MLTRRLAAVHTSRHPHRAPAPRRFATEFDLEAEEYVLVALCDTRKSNKPMALAGWRKGKSKRWDHRPVLARNMSAPSEIQERFDEYLPKLSAQSMNLDR